MNSEASVLAPGFLIASPPLGDPNFDRTVVLLAVHSEGGALGFVVNRPAPMSLGELLSFAGYGNDLKDPAPVYLGGPVQPSSGWILCLDPALGAEETGVIPVTGSARCKMATSLPSPSPPPSATVVSASARVTRITRSGPAAGDTLVFARGPMANPMVDTAAKCRQCSAVSTRFGAILLQSARNCG